MHLTDSDLQAFVNGELTGENSDAVIRHLAECEACTAREQNARRTDELIDQWLATLDHQAPVIRVDTVIARAHRTAPPRRRIMAAGIAAVLAASAAAAAIPGTPVHRYFRNLIGGDASSQRVERPAGQSVPADLSTRGAVAFTPGEAVTVSFSSDSMTGVVKVVVNDSALVRVRHFGGRAGYTVRDTEIIVDNRGSAASFEITVPRSVARAQVVVGGRTVLTKLGAQILTAGTRVGDDAFVITPGRKAGE